MTSRIVFSDSQIFGLEKGNFSEINPITKKKKKKKKQKKDNEIDWYDPTSTRQGIYRCILHAQR